MEHLWSKLKTYLASWKVTNFGSGAYNNTGNLRITTEGSIYVSGNLNINHSDFLMTVSSTNIEMSCRSVQFGVFNLEAYEGTQVFTMTTPSGLVYIPPRNFPYGYEYGIHQTYGGFNKVLVIQVDTQSTSANALKPVFYDTISPNTMQIINQKSGDNCGWLIFW